MKLFIYSLLLCCLLACSAPRYGGETLARLEAQPLASGEQQSLAATAEQTIASYRALMAFPVDNPQRPAAMQRLGDLLLDYGEAREIELAARSEQTAIAEYDEAISVYETLLTDYPAYAGADQVIYQLARAYDKKGAQEKTMALLQRLINEHPHSHHLAEAQFRLGELRFLFGELAASAGAYAAVLQQGQADPYHQHALLKYSWALFKQDRLDEALVSFFKLIDSKLANVAFDPLSGEPLALGKAEEELLNDSLRGMVLAFALKNSTAELDRYCREQGRELYNHLIYQRLAAFYQNESRHADAAAVYGAYVAAYPDALYAPVVQIRLVEAYLDAREFEAAIKAKQRFLNDFHWQTGVNAVYLGSHAQAYLHELSAYYHARYQQQKRQSDYDAAVNWYRRYLSDFGAAPDAAEKHFLLAELLYQHGDYPAAAQQYEIVAYALPLNTHGAQAAYGAILSYGSLLQAEPQSPQWRRLQYQSGLRFISAFPQDARLPATALSLANHQFESGYLDEARVLIELLLDEKQPRDQVTRQRGWMLLGHIAFRQQEYLRAEQSFQTARLNDTRGSGSYAEAENWLALSIYRQAEQLQTAGDESGAVAEFVRVAAVAPASEIQPQALFDAAALLIRSERWQEAATLLESFRIDHATHPLMAAVPDKLAFVYLKLGRNDEAAAAFEQVAAQQQDGDMQQAALLEAARLYQQSGNAERAIGAYRYYLERFPALTFEAFEARQRLALLYEQQGQYNSRDHWYGEIIAKAAAPAVAADDRIQHQAAVAAFQLAEKRRAEFEAIVLVAPLRDTMARKKERLQAALNAYEQVSFYGFADYLSAASQRIGELYVHFGRALLDSERPAELNAEELEQYDIMLEEQAYPFEEKAIAILQTNLARINDGLYNEWIQQSITTLAGLLPLQYAKQEQMREVIDAMH